MSQTSGASANKPFFRYDLHTQAIEEAGSRFVEVSCPDSGNSFRFYEVEYAVACGMDGERDLSGIVAWAKTERTRSFGVEPLSAAALVLRQLASVAEMTRAKAPIPNRPVSASITEPEHAEYIDAPVSC